MWFLVIQSSNEERREHLLKPGRNALGRRADNDIILQDAAASGWHAEIQYEQGHDSISIRDLDSTNGTFVNGTRIHNPCILHHQDRIRIGLCFLTLVSTDMPTPEKSLLRSSRTKVTSELILESVDHYGGLLHEIGQRLVSIPDLDSALFEITALIKRMIGAEECRIVLADRFEQLEGMEIPASVIQATIKHQSASVVQDGFGEPSAAAVDGLDAAPAILLVPVLIGEEVVALILARKSAHALSSFYDSDLQLALAVSNQIAMSIQRHRIEGQLLHSSDHDALTDLPNRNLFLRRLGDAIARNRQQEGMGFAVLFFDIDNFKLVNDSLGHLVGDRLLIAISDRLKHNVREIDFVSRASVISRFGGDEFAILLEGIKESRFALAAATRLKELMAKPYEIDGKEIFVAVSIGVAMSTNDYERPEDILRDADTAMYRAKELGKERVVVYDKAMHTIVLRRMQIGNALRQGALQKEFRLHYQPIVSLQNGRVMGHEALLRWYTSTGEILLPGDFMDAIDTAGLLYTADHWVLENACTQELEWNKQLASQPQLFISVNMSPKYFRHPNLVQNIEEVLRQTGLEPAQLWVEVTEKVSAADDESAIAILRNLHSIGIHISLDDFGTGYSALNYLARFPIDALKIDRSFIRMIGAQAEGSKIIEMIQTLANHLGLILIAEGVETLQQVTFLRSIRCEYAQGYFFARPMDARTATRQLVEGARGSRSGVRAGEKAANQGETQEGGAPAPKRTEDS